MKLNSNFAVHKIGDSYYAVPLKNNTAVGSAMIKLNETAYFVWDYIEKGFSEEQIADALCAEYDVARAQALSDVLSIVGKFREAGILEGNS